MGLSGGLSSRNYHSKRAKQPRDTGFGRSFTERPRVLFTRKKMSMAYCISLICHKLHLNGKIWPEIAFYRQSATKTLQRNISNAF